MPPPFQIDHEIARSTTSMILKATAENGEEFALKVGLSSKDSAASNQWVAIHSRIAALGGKHTVRAIACLEVSDQIAFQLELTAGDIIGVFRSNRLSPNELLATIQTIGLALDELHENGIVHRNVNPSHILIDSRGNACLCGFGSAVDMMNPSVIELQAPEFRAPEIQNGIVSVASDQWALAKTFVEVRNTCGVQFDEAETRGMDAPLGRALNPNPSLRFHTCTAFANELHASYFQRN